MSSDSTPITAKESPLRLAFLGGGTNSAVGGAHRAALSLDGLFQLTAGCFSEEDEINRDSAIQYGIPDIARFKSLDELLEKDPADFDAIVILTPTPCHHAHTIRCLEAGVPVICEKSVGTTSAEVAEIRNVARSRDGFVVPIYNYTGYPMVRELKDMIAAGRLGRIQQLHVEMPQEGFLRRQPDGSPPHPQSWRETDGDVPTVSLDLGVHAHHLVHFLCNEHPERAVATESRFGAVQNVVDNVIAIAEYSGGIVCNFWYGKTALGYRNGLRVRVCGDEGSAEWFQMEPETLFFNDLQGGRHSIDRGSDETRVACQDRYTRFKVGHPAGFIEAFANHYEDIADAYRAHQRGESPENPYVATIDIALEGMLFLEALTRSSNQHEWVRVG